AEELVIGPSAALGGHRGRVAEARMGGTGAPDDAVEIGTDLVGAVLVPDVALLATLGDFLAGGDIGGRYGRGEIGQLFHGRRSRRPAFSAHSCTAGSGLPHVAHVAEQSH